MPVKVFNETSGRDEEKVFGENTNRTFSSIDVPSIEEIEHLNAHLVWLDGERNEILQLLKVQDQAFKDLSMRMLDREHAETIVAELKSAISDTTVFTNVLYSTLDAHEQRLLDENLKVREEVQAFHQQADAAAQTAGASLNAYRTESQAGSLALETKVTEIKALLKLAMQIQDETRVHSQEFSELLKWQAWSTKMQQGGLWARLVWIFRGTDR